MALCMLLSNNPQLNSLVISLNVISADEVLRIISDKSLQLTSLTVKSFTRINVETMVRCVEKLRILKEMRVYLHHYDEYLSDWDNGHFFFDDVSKNRKIEIQNMKIDSLLQSESCENIFQQTLNINVLKFQCVSELSDKCIRSMVCDNPHLHTLCIVCCSHQCGLASLQHVLLSCPNPTDLELSDCDHLRDTDFATLYLETPHKLNVLNVRYNNEITFDTALRIVQQNMSICYVRITQCNKISWEEDCLLQEAAERNKKTAQT